MDWVIIIVIIIGLLIIMAIYNFIKLTFEHFRLNRINKMKIKIHQMRLEESMREFNNEFNSFKEEIN